MRELENEVNANNARNTRNVNNTNKGNRRLGLFRRVGQVRGGVGEFGKKRKVSEDI